MIPLRILIAGIGNIFLGDDAFGVEVIHRLLHRPRMKDVTISDFGIRGLDLTYALLENYDLAILVDAVPRGETPGTIFLIAPDPISDDSIPTGLDMSSLMIDSHNMDPARVLKLVAAMGGNLQHVLVVGCEPTPFDSETDMDMSLSEPVKAAVEAAVPFIESLVAKIRTGEFELSTPFHESSCLNPKRSAVS
jgi:hydrogenase maturation protease